MASNIQKAYNLIKAEVDERNKNKQIDDTLIALNDLVKVLENFEVEEIKTALYELRKRGDWRVIKFRNGTILAIPLNNKR